jgi:hypothetical protein
MTTNQLKAKWIRLAAGALAILVLFAVMAFVSPPPGPTGDIVRRNVREDIDATHYVYTDVEGIFEMGRELELRIEEHKNINTPSR